MTPALGVQQVSALTAMESTKMITDTVRIVGCVTTECECLTDNDTPSDFCYGCDEDNREHVQTMIDLWLERQTIQTNRVRVYSPSMGWLRQEAWTVTDVTSLLDSIRLNGDYRLNFMLDGVYLSAVRYSHDEPTGAPFVFNLITEEDEL